ncbi:GNAT family N-acetyltransferase [Vibrio sp. SCSIO 43132]|uniref:GNAT family N-acetyltransferase n=1 Tax=Vibrio sp. SCSIO 43132 TaxID=2779363 RepID=UPI001CA8B741|nr:GNAT family N-acetyltransferase [Vibrio sp. SCSIO 43132]UAB73484.1 GNAT family N-acetyltransferase [Vibrio sp. SCSIO 43132]
MEKLSCALVPFSEDDFEYLTDWIVSKELTYLWAGPTFQYPLTHEQLRKHCQQPEVIPFLIKYDDQAAGFVELNRQSETHCRICLVFVSDSFRGKGISKTILTMLADVAKNDYGCNKLSLAVFSHNQRAKKVYQSLGFKTVSIEKEAMHFKEKTWDLERMERLL